jgi:Tat protein secretion system quality control protein TatD with DNase activity
MREVIPQIPPHRLLFETDDAPQSIAWVYEQYAKLTMQPLVDLCLQIEQNFLAIFGPWEIG